MDLQTASSELKRLLAFIKPIANAVPLLDELIKAETEYSDLQNSIRALTEKQETIARSVEEYQQKLQIKRDEVRTEIAKIENDIQAQKELLLEEYDKKITAKEEELKSLISKHEETKTNISKMRFEETGLRKRVHELKKLLVNTESEIEKVGE